MVEKKEVYSGKLKLPEFPTKARARKNFAVRLMTANNSAPILIFIKV
jgi:hypothetical protein